MAKVVVLGAGPAGLGASLELAEKGVDVTLLERNAVVGGNAGSFEIAGVHVDYGSHRLHPASNPEVLARVNSLLRDQLLTRPRHGRIRLLGRWIHFPLRPVDLFLHLHPRFSAGVFMDLASQVLPNRGPGADETFESVLQRGLGKTICAEFYFPYARKIWGLEPREISLIQAHKRVSSGTIMKMLKRLIPGGRGTGGNNTKGIFYYPKRGYGQICEALLTAAQAAGANVVLEADIKKVQLNDPSSTVTYRSGNEDVVINADQVFSTIPVTVLTRMLEPAAPQAVLDATNSLEFRSMLLIYLVLDQQQFTEFDAHYFPEIDVRLTRLSEPKNYSASLEPAGKTVLCGELPCSMDDPEWNMSDEELGELMKNELTQAGLPVASEILDVHVRRLPFAYPLYRIGYEKPMELIDDWLSAQPGILTFGRQGLYVHDNTHHALYMAQAAAQCLNDDGTIDAENWKREREIFATHVVED